MTHMKLESILNVGTKSQSDAIHLAAAREIMIRNPELVYDLKTRGGVNIVVGRFKEDYYSLEFSKLNAMVNSLCGVKQTMFSRREVSSPLSLLGTDDVMISVLDIASAEMPLFKESCDFFGANLSTVKHVPVEG